MKNYPSQVAESTPATPTVAESAAPFDTRQVSICRNAKATECETCAARSVVEKIRAGLWQQPVEHIRAEYKRAIAQARDAKEAVSELKKRLPGILWSGTFSTRKSAALVDYSDLLCADLDNLPTARLVQVRALLEANPHVVALFLSPTGTGLKVVFRVPAGAEQHAASFAAVAAHVRQLCGVEIDPACKDVARLCFVSYDPQAYWNGNARELQPLAKVVVHAPTPSNNTITAPSPLPAGALDLATRRRLASELLGEIEFTSETNGLCTCPGQHLHTTANGPRDCEVRLDGAPTIHCFHGHCSGLVDAANRELRSRVGKAEHVPAATAPTTPTDEAAFRKLAALSAADYDRQREAEAERLGIRVSTLDAAVALRRTTAAGSVQGGTVDFPALEQWPHPVNGAEVLTAVAATFRRYVCLPAHTADALALWTAYTHAYEAFIHSPRLNLASPEKQCGKTVTLDVIASLVPRAMRTESITPAVLFRIVEGHKPTLLLDEVDTYLENNDELRGLLNAGHKRGAKAYRCEGDKNEVRAFAAFAPAVLAGIGSLPGTLHDRSIRIQLVRAKPGEIPAQFDSRRTAAESELCRKLARWATDNLTPLENCDPTMPGNAFNRLADNWRPLFAVAEIAGGDWPARATAAFESLTGGDDPDAHGIGTALLSDVRAIFTDRGTNRETSAVIATSLAAMDGTRWPEYGKGGKPISPNQLARLLARFNIKSRTIRVGDDTAKGYHLEDFDEAFERYLPPSSLSNRHTVTTPANIDDSSLFETSHPESVLRFENAVTANEINSCDGVTFPKGGCPTKSEIDI